MHFSKTRRSLAKLYSTFGNKISYWTVSTRWRARAYFLISEAWFKRDTSRVLGMTPSTPVGSSVQRRKLVACARQMRAARASDIPRGQQISNEYGDVRRVVVAISERTLAKDIAIRRGCFQAGSLAAGNSDQNISDARPRCTFRRVNVTGGIVVHKHCPE